MSTGPDLGVFDIRKAFLIFFNLKQSKIENEQRLKQEYEANQHHSNNSNNGMSSSPQASVRNRPTYITNNSNVSFLIGN